MWIIGRPSANYFLNLRLPENTSQVFTRDMLPALWGAAEEYCIDPVGLVAQSLKETGNGNFGGQITAQYYNTCGLKQRHIGKYPGVDDGDRPLAHAQFPNWEVGARAHAQHVRAYAGWPVKGLILSPRYVFVIGQYKLDHWSEFGGGKWAPSPTYGQEIEQIMQRIVP